MTKCLDMTEGNPLTLLCRFAFPTLLGNLLHQAYSITDSIVVGRYLGQTALAAVGCTTPIIMLLAALLVGINTAVGIIISQSYGRKDNEGMRNAFINSLYLGAAVAAALAVFGIPLSEPILRWMGTPQGPLQDAAAYLRINFLTSLCPMLYYLFSSAFRGMGDSRTALYCLIIAAVCNIGLDILFVAGFGWGVAGTAWATALSQALSACFAFILLYHQHPQMRFKIAELRLDIVLFFKIARMAIPIALQAAFNNLGNLVAQSGINTFGETVMAAYTASSRIGTLALMPIDTIASSLSIYVGQNDGAKKPKRVREGVRAALIISLFVSIVLAVFLLWSGGALSKLFLSSPSKQLLSVVQRYLIIAVSPCFLAGIMQVYQQALRGLGRANQALAGGLMQLFAKIGVVALGAWVFNSLDIVWLGWPLSFIAGSIVPIIYFRRYLREG